MRRIGWLIVLALTMLPAGAHALQLRWSTGGIDTSFSENVRAILVVEADSAGTTLPPLWTLQWIADSSGVQAEAQDSILACLGDTARVDTIQGPATPADSAANLVTAHFCSGGSSTAASAYYVLDLLGGSRGRLRAVALASDSSVIESNEVTYNQGVSGTFEPVILSSTSTHVHGELTVNVEGAGLAAAQGLNIAATDGSWSFPLAIVGRSDSSITAHRVLAATLPQCMVQATIGVAPVATATVDADSFPPLEPRGSSSYFSASLDTAGMLAKDFAFVDAGDEWHIFYTREYQTGYGDYENQRLIGHAVSTDRNLNTWTVETTLCDTCSVHARPGRIWDNLHVWAPCIVRKPGDMTYYMLYTGVELDTISQQPTLQTSQIQRIGMATSTDLFHWTQDASPLYWNKKVPWTYQDSTHNATNIGGDEFFSEAWQFRDPFVAPDPDNAERYLHYFAAVDSCAQIAGSGGCSSQYLVGVARTPAGDPGNLRKWEDVGPLLRTSQSHMAADRVESPTWLARGGSYWLMYTAAHEYGDQLTFTLNPHPAALDTTTWTAPDSLKAITCGQHNFPSPLNLWHAPEALNLTTQEYLMAWSDDLLNGGTIQFSQIKPPDATCPSDTFQLVTPYVVAVPAKAGILATAPMALTLAGPSPARSTARLRISLASPMRVHIAVYDVFGRRVRTLVNGALTSGSTPIVWDGRAEHGGRVSSGIYFVRATCAAGRQAVRVPLIR
ncbi:MAG TPA: FlgD immunoglobulin-like domain containing protein [Candidatus Eisenbacteria bacterium]|nr:FlgD immunoglobulin-like domain containing protein [Candidatus Eisenbacteria bacterium]